MQMHATMWLRGIGGALLGAGLGFAGFELLARGGLYAMVLPGALAGMCAGRFSGAVSNAIGAATAAIAAVAIVLTEWNFAPFSSDNSFGYFIQHIHEVIPTHLLIMAIGVGFAFWFGRGRERFVTAKTSHTGSDKSE